MLSKKAILKYLPIILFIILAALLRFIWLDKVPSAVGGDEMNYLITAKSIAVSGSDLTGTWNPLSIFLFNYPPGQSQAELLYFLLLPVVGLVNFSLFWARIENAVFGVFIVYLIYLITSRLFNRQTGIIAGFISAINPWLIYISRTSYEMIPATLFYLLSFYFLSFAKGKRLLISIPFLILAFYSYIATKVFFLPFVLLTVFYSYFYINNKKYKKEFLAVLGVSVLLVIFFIFSLKLHPSMSRLGEIANPNDPAIAKQVNQLRSVSIQNPLTNLIENKYTVFLTIESVKLFSIFSANYLFLNGDNFFSIFSNGLFYYLDALFLLLGMVFVFSNKRKIFYLLVSLILLASLPHLVHGVSTENFTPHVTLIFPFMIIFIAAGIWESVSYFKNKLFFYSSISFLIILYLLLVLNFLNIYFYQFPLQGNFDFPIRIVSKYAVLSQKNGNKVIVYSTRSYDIFTKYLFYAGSLNKNTYLTIRKNLAKQDYEIGNIKFLGCDNTIDPAKTKNTIIYDGECAPPIKSFSKLIIPRLTDGGESYAIYKDNVCKGYSLKGFPSGIKISDLSIEKMSAKNFCETYITSF